MSERYGERVLGAASTVEERRLAAIAEVADGWTRQVLGRVGVAAGWRCLEVGAGSGTVAAWLARLVAARGAGGGVGSVVATDLDMRFLERLAEPGLSRDHRVAREDDDWSATDLGHLAPPHLATCWNGAHDDAAARRNDARSPHSSGSSSGCSSYAA